MSGSLLQQSEKLISISANEICQASGGELLAGSPEARVDCVSTDTRDDLRGCLFIGLKGGNFDGGDFLEEAVAQGAAGVLAERPAAMRVAAGLASQNLNGSTPMVVAVDDPGAALKKVASLVAGKSLAKIVAITGSTGKTSTKDMLFSLLSPQADTIASRASFNNEVGVPLTLLRLESQTRVAVLEMGMQAPGEIGDLCRIVAPEIAVITNIGPAHLEYSGSLENIARGKAEIAQNLPPHGGLVMPHGEKLLEPYVGDLVAEVVTFGFDEAADIHPVFHRHSAEGGIDCRICVMGEEIDVHLGFAAHHHLLNFMAALGAYTLLGLPLRDVATAAAGIQLSGMRGEVIELDSGVMLLNDCYNANPLSMASSMEYLVSLAMGRRTVAVLGDMGELGADAARYHRETGKKIPEFGIDCLIAVGELAAAYVEGSREAGGCRQPEECYHFAGREEALGQVPALIGPGDIVLVKASRFMKLEEISAAIIAANGGKDVDASCLPEA